MEGRDGGVVDHVQEGSLDGNGRPAVPDVEGVQGSVLADIRERSGPGAEFEVDGVDAVHVVHLFVGEQHHGAVRRVLGLHLVTDKHRVLRLEHVADAETQLRLGDTHGGQLALHTDVSHERAFGGDDTDALGEGLDVEIALHEHGDVKVLVLDAGRTAHAEGNETISHEARPPYAFPQTLLGCGHGR